MTETAIITSKGQVTLPRSIRSLLNSRVVLFEQTQAGVLIKPVTSVAGSLHAFAANAEPQDISAIRETVWKEVTDEKTYID